ncbi:hypothetical protein FL966_00780 [Caproiciproducens galactitolivorans]|uniref:Phage Mu protein F like protein n=1 Tax=Caproiciproducens galactitolivorans TaxID=642589 RepID=A0A4Z0XV65_9FIRM|nr:minor capsid protein [Caproiciproducens galactitolivorans]QEY33710.1 hypothetical protein FL966_00780 [Caproiciproducens galactitolivorans]TGJ75339.1 phage Mu protein F like protein [Caproiciproducens galactitolivorans]
MFRFLKHLFGIPSGENLNGKTSGDSLGTNDKTFNNLEESTLDLDIEGLDQQGRIATEQRYQKYIDILCRFNPHDLRLCPESAEPHFNSVELAFLKYIDGTSIKAFAPAQYWYYEYGLNYKAEIAKFISAGLLLISPLNDIEKKTIPQLKEVLRIKNLPLSGKKSELIRRIYSNFTETEIETFLPKGEEYYILTEKGKELVAGLKKSATKNLELEDHCIELILNNKINEAYKAVAAFRASVPGQSGLGIDWNEEKLKGLSKRYLSTYQKMLNYAKSDDERKVAACCILCEVMGIPHKKCLMINRVCDSTGKEFLDKLIERETLLAMKQAIREELKEYKQDGITQYQILAALDTETCPLCGKMDSKVFNISEAKIGKNCPPFHSGCRCCITPFIPEYDDLAGPRAARDPVTGKSITVPMMSYTEWYKKYIEGK